MEVLRAVFLLILSYFLLFLCTFSRIMGFGRLFWGASSIYLMAGGREVFGFWFPGLYEFDCVT